MHNLLICQLHNDFLCSCNYILNSIDIVKLSLVNNILINEFLWKRVDLNF